MSDEPRAQSIIQAVVILESDAHPESLAMQVPSILLRIPVLRARRGRNISRLLLWIIALAALGVTIPPFNLSSKYASLIPVVAVVCGILPFIGLYPDMPKVAARFNSLVNNSGLFIYLIVFITLALSILLVVISTRPQSVFGGLATVIISIYMLHFFNQYSTAKTWSGRAALRTVACATHVIFSFCAVSLLVGLIFYPGIAAQRLSAPADAGSLWTVVGLIVTSGGLVLGLTSRIIVRQRRYKAQLLIALNDVGLRLVHDCEPQDLHRSVLELDSYLATGVDTGSYLFRTSYETQHLRTTLSILFARLGCPTFDKEDPVFLKTSSLVEHWDEPTVKQELFDFIKIQRKFLNFAVDRIS